MKTESADALHKMAEAEGKQRRFLPYIGEILFVLSGLFAVAAVLLLTVAPINISLGLGVLASYCAVSSYQVDKGGK